MNHTQSHEWLVNDMPHHMNSQNNVILPAVSVSNLIKQEHRPQFWWGKTYSRVMHTRYWQGKLQYICCYQQLQRVNDQDIKGKFRELTVFIKSSPIMQQTARHRQQMLCSMDQYNKHSCSLTISNNSLCQNPTKWVVFSSRNLTTTLYHFILMHM